MDRQGKFDLIFGTAWWWWTFSSSSFGWLTIFAENSFLAIFVFFTQNFVSMQLKPPLQIPLKGEDFLIVPIQRFKESIWENSDYADWKMCTMRPWKICNSFDITHQAHIRGGWKIWILCHLCSNQNNFMIFGFLKAMWICQD